MSAVSFLAGLGAGYIKAKDKAYDRARQEKKEKQEDDLYNFKMDEMRQAQADKADLRAASAPVSVQAEAGPPTEAMVAATPAGQEPAAIGYLAGSGTSAKKFASQGVADTYAAEQNTPNGTRTRQMAALAAQGNVLGADQLRTSGITADAGQMALDAGKRKEANEVFDTGLRTALQTSGPQGLAEFMSKSAADGNGGATKFTAVMAPDGKTWQMHRVGEEGKTTPMGQSFSNDEGGMATAGMMLSRAVPDTEKVKHLQAEREAARKAKHDDGTLAVAQQRANTEEAYRRDMSAAARARAGAGGGGGGSGAGGAQQASFDPLGSFDTKKAQAVAMEQASKTTDDKGNPLTPAAQGQLAQQIYRSMEDSFASENTSRERARVFRGVAMSAKTPEEVNEVRARALQSGYTEQEMAQLDPRFRVEKPKPAQAAPGPAPVAAPRAAPAPVAQRAAPTIAPQHAAAMAPLNAAVQQAATAMAAGARSGDPRAIATYSAQLEAAKRARAVEAARRFGEQGAQQYIATLTQ